MRFLIAATIATLAIGTTAVNAQIESEIEVLKSIATSTGGWENVKSKPWLVSTASTACSSIDGWDGIKCEKIAEQDRVVEISFPFRKNINGTISAIELNKLPYLRKIYISETEISGALPNFSSHPGLEEIEITLNPKLTSPITALPSQLYRIQIWNNGWNQGALPSLDSVNATTLRWFNFESSQVTGTIPSFEKFINLESVSLTGNKITGGIPRFNPPLRELFLGRNELTVFDVANLPVTLRQFSINTNKIVAPFPNLGKLTDAYNIDLSNNGFYGQVPLASIPAPSRGSNQTYQNDYYTYRLDISKNSLTGAVPPLTNSWLQSRATPAGVIHKIWWYTDCNLFQTGLPELPAMFSECYDNKDTARCAQICPPKLPGSSTITTPPPNTNTNTNTTTSPPTKPAGPKNDAAATTTTAASVFTGVFALCAAFAARF